MQYAPKLARSTEEGTKIALTECSVTASTTWGEKAAGKVATWTGTQMYDQTTE